MLDEMIPKLDYKGNNLVSYDYDYSGQHMGERKVTVKIESPIAIDFSIRDFIFLDDKGFYYLQTIPSANRVFSSEMITYNLTFWWTGYAGWLCRAAGL